MTGAVLQIDSSDLGRVGDRLERLAARTRNMKPAMDDIGAMLVASVQDRFEKGVDPDGKPWTPSIRVQHAQKKAQTLVDSARLASSITHDPGPTSVEVGANVVYAAIHQFGGQAGRNKSVTIPARPYLGLSIEDKREIGNIIDDYLMEAFK